MKKLLGSIAVLCLSTLIGLLLEALIGAPWATVVLAVILLIAILMALRSSK